MQKKLEFKQNIMQYPKGKGDAYHQSGPLMSEDTEQVRESEA